MHRLLVLSIAVLILAGCQRGNHSEKTYDLQGKIIAIDPAKKTVRINHKDIPGHMQAMEMDFHVDDAKLLDNFQVGDEIVGKLLGTNKLLELKKK